jgi:isoleucyl-tRNA synthetase
MANGVSLVARSFKYHRPRGIMSAGAEEACAIVQLGSGARTDPNCRATQIELFDGLAAASLNCWPNVQLDLGVINDRLHRLLPAGFYYKTFMWPRRGWLAYERLIRSAAGLGRAPTEPDPDRYEKIEDILDVWFDSGSTHAFTLEGRKDSRWPADLYSEGSDQHRGWFQSSLLEACGTRGRAPYQAVMTHGFTLDEKGEKMSKSLGNSVEPQDVIAASGAEILRLWTALSDYTEDQRIGAAILQTTTDAYRKLRNTVRYLLGALDGFTPAEAVAEFPPLERFILHRLWELDQAVRAGYKGYNFSDAVRALADFCSNDLSAWFFDIRRDVLYCDRPDSMRRRACRTVMDLTFERLTAWLSPVIPFTMEEAWGQRFPDGRLNSIRTFPETPASWRNDAEAARWAKVQRVTAVVTGALEIERREKRIGGALEAAPLVHIADPELMAAFEGLDAAEVIRTSQARLVAGDGPADAFRLTDTQGVAVEPLRAEGMKCARSWRILPEVGSDPRYPDLSLRDADAVAAWDAARA